jgi:hypothetical protein
VRRALLVVVALGALAVGAGAGPAAAATNECRGLQFCVRVAGPWVVVPARLTVPRAEVQFQLSCPRGFIVGGFDAELSDPAIDVAFLGKLGAPVSPGAVTSRRAMVLGTYTGGSSRTPTFRPHLGCVPAGGGGGGPVPYLPPQAQALFPPGEPTTRRVAQRTLRAGRTTHVVRGCSAGERLVSAWHAVGFFTTTAPAARLVRAVTSTGKLLGGRADVRVQAGAPLRGVRAIVQVGAVCGGGR